MCRLPARTEDTTTSAVVVVSPVRVFRPDERVRRSGIPRLAPLEGHANAGGPGAALRPQRLHRHPPGSTSGRSVTRPRAPRNSGRKGLPAARSQAATRRWPTSPSHSRQPHPLRPAPEDARSGRRASVGPCGRDTPASVDERGSRAHSRHRTRVSSNGACGARLRRRPRPGGSSSPPGAGTRRVALEAAAVASNSGTRRARSE
jgi:hypothetical protein